MQADVSSPPAPSRMAFRFGDGSVAVLLIHGLTGTPTEVKTVAKTVARSGFSVYGIQLSGHCGTEADLLKTGWRDWLKDSLDAFDDIRQTHATVFVGGLSMGALLSLAVAAERPGRVAGCLCYAPTMFYDGWSVPKLSIMLHAAILLGLGRFVRFRENFPYGIKDERIRARILKAMTAGDSAGAEPRAAAAADIVPQGPPCARPGAGARHSRAQRRRHQHKKCRLHRLENRRTGGKDIAR